jgi:alpha-tubulin suppressor-like RCC1 family protein
MPHGGQVAVILGADGTTYVFGHSSHGQLGAIDLTSIVTELTRIEIPVHLKSISVGAHHCIGVTYDGFLWGWGSNESGQLGQGSEQIIYQTPTQIPNIGDIASVEAGSLFSIALDNNGQVWGFGTNEGLELGMDAEFKQVLIPTRNELVGNITQIAAGQYHWLALDIDGQVAGTVQ